MSIGNGHSDSSKQSRRKPRALWFAIPAGAMVAAMVSPLVPAAVAADGLPCAPGVNTVTYSDAMADYRDTPWSGETLDLTQFNGGPGRVLTKVDLSRTEDVKQRIWIFSTAPSAEQTVNFVRSTGTINTTATGLPAFPPVDIAFERTNFQLAPLEQVYLPGPTAATFDEQTKTQVDSFSDASSLAVFTGTGNVVVSGQATGSLDSSTTPSGNSGSANYTYAKFSASVTYSYVCSWMAITKTVSAAAGATAPTEWQFSFTISPAPADGSAATVSVTQAQPRAVWSGLVAGTAYTVTETASPGYTQGGVTCGATSGGTTAVGGQTVECTANNTYVPPPPCITPPPGTPPGATPPPGGTWCYPPTTPPTPCVTPSPGVTPSPSSTPPGGGTWCVTPTPDDTCAAVGSDGNTTCTAVPLSVKAKKATSKVSRSKWVTVITSAKTTSVGSISKSLTCYKADGTTTTACKKKYGKSNSVKVKVSSCTAATVKVAITAAPKAAYEASYTATNWTRTWSFKAC